MPFESTHFISIQERERESIWSRSVVSISCLFFSHLCRHPHPLSLPFLSIAVSPWTGACCLLFGASLSSSIAFPLSFCLFLFMCISSISLPLPFTSWIEVVPLLFLSASVNLPLSLSPHRVVGGPGGPGHSHGEAQTAEA